MKQAEDQAILRCEAYSCERIVGKRVELWRTLPTGRVKSGEILRCSRVISKLLVGL
jgi:hypothetical protein